MRAFQVRVDQLVEALFRCVENVAAFPWCDAGIIHQQVEAVREESARVFDERLAIFRGTDVASKDRATSLRAQNLGMIHTPQVRAQDAVRRGKLTRDASSNAAA